MLLSVAKVGTHFGYRSGTADQHSCWTGCGMYRASEAEASECVAVVVGEAVKENSKSRSSQWREKRRRRFPIPLNFFLVDFPGK
jgi:hypothetical protein